MEDDVLSTSGGAEPPDPCRSDNKEWSRKIRVLNDNFRSTFVGGAVVVTAGFESLPLGVKAEALLAVRSYDDFHPGNDPHGEHDFGRFDVANETIIWKMDYYDREMQNGSEDPSDPSKTTRILTVMLAEEY